MRPAKRLQTHLETLAEERADVLLEPQTLRGGKSFGTTICDHIDGFRLDAKAAEELREEFDGCCEFVKLAHLSQVREYFTDDPSRFQTVFGTDRTSASLFDRWYELDYTPRDVDDLDNYRDLLIQFRDLIDFSENRKLRSVILSLISTSDGG